MKSLDLLVRFAIVVPAGKFNEGDFVANGHHLLPTRIEKPAFSLVVPAFPGVVDAERNV